LPDSGTELGHFFIGTASNTCKFSTSGFDKGATQRVHPLDGFVISDEIDKSVIKKLFLEVEDSVPVPLQ
jgi:hypothetical protein